MAFFISAIHDKASNHEALRAIRYHSEHTYKQTTYTKMQQSQ
ncbi:hypothetical protein RCT00_11635 [Escherichia coli]|nr:hypothetical protein [Escherichia coli]MEC9633544.1 hypothetical protein [Escherichia coli]